MWTSEWRKLLILYSLFVCLQLVYFLVEARKFSLPFWSLNGNHRRCLATKFVDDLQM